MSDSDQGLSRAQIFKQLDASLISAEDRSHRSLPVPSLRRINAACRDDGGPDRGHPAGQGALYRLRRVAARQDRGGGGAEGRCAVRFEPTAIFPALALSADRYFPPLRRFRHYPDRLVPACPGRFDGEIQSRRASAAPIAREQPVNGLDAAQALAGGSGCWRRSRKSG